MRQHLLKYKWLKYCLTLIILNVNFKINAQIIWKSSPSDGQFYSRNLNPSDGPVNKAKIIFEGKVTQSGFNKIEITHIGNNGTKTNYIAPLLYNAYGQATFKRPIFIESGKIKHAFEISLINSTGTVLISLFKDIICGDAYLINGQSNSVANSYGGLSNTNYRDSFIRSFGSSAPNNVAATKDSNWYIANGDGMYNIGCVGQWGLVFAKNVLDSTGIPICIINSGVGGTPITYHQKNITNPTDPNTNYGRMLYRTYKAGLKEKVRGIFWFQGESDGIKADLHDSLFKKMHNEWLVDYPNLENITVIQVRSGCGSPSLALREKQRQFLKLNRTSVFTANGLNAHDGCHYKFIDGYEKLGRLIFNQLKHKLYILHNDQNNQALHPYEAYYSNSYKNEICLNFSPLKAQLKVDSGFIKLFSINGSSIKIVSAYAKDNAIYFKLSGSDCKIKSISYDGLSGMQPWVKSIADAPLMSFHEFPINQIKKYDTIHVCKGINFKLGNDSIFGNTYTWYSNKSSNISNRSNPIFKGMIDEMYTCIIKTNAAGCQYDTVYQNVLLDSVSSPNLNHQYYLCKDDSLKFNIRKNDWNNIEWEHNGFKFKQTDATIKDTGFWVVKVSGNNNCQSMDSFYVAYYNRLIKYLPDSIWHCNNQITWIKNNPLSRENLWNRKYLSDSFVLSDLEEYIYLNYKDTNQCDYKDSVFSCVLRRNDSLWQTNYSICKNDTITIKKSSNYKAWQWENSPINTESKTIKLTGRFHVKLIDHKECVWSDSVKVDQYPEHIIQALDTSICENETIEINAPKWLKNWKWNQIVKTNQFILKQSDSFQIKYTDTNACNNTTHLKINVINFPITQKLKDTTLCFGDTLWLTNRLSNAKNEWINEKPINYPMYLTNTNKLQFKCYDLPRCQIAWECSIQFNNCDTLSIITSHQKLNPQIWISNGQLHNLKNEDQQYVIYAMNGVELIKGIISIDQHIDITLPKNIYILCNKSTSSLNYQWQTVLIE